MITRKVIKMGGKKTIALLTVVLIMGNFIMVSGAEDAYPRTIVDSAGRIVNVRMPIKRIITLTTDGTEAVRMLGCADKIVAVNDYITRNKEYYPELSKVFLVGTWKEFNYERIVKILVDSNNVIIPDVLLISHISTVREVEKALSSFGNITIAAFDLCNQSTLEDELTKMGYILEKEDRAQDFIDWYESREAEVTIAVSGLDSPRVYIEHGYTTQKDMEFKTYSIGSAIDELCKKAGGYNIASDLTKYPTVSWEWVMYQNPDVIIKEIPGTFLPGWSDTTTTEDKRNEVMNRIGGKDIAAIKNGNVYITTRSINLGLQRVVGLTYWAKIFHPEVDLDPERVLEEYLVKYQGLEYSKDRVVVYPDPNA